MFKKYMKKVLAFTLAGALAFSGAQIAGIGGANVASAATITSLTVGIEDSSKTVASYKQDDLTLYDGTGYVNNAKLTTGYLWVNPASNATITVSVDAAWGADFEPSITTSGGFTGKSLTTKTAAGTQTIDFQIGAPTEVKSTDITAGPNIVIKINESVIRLIATNSNFTRSLGGKSSIDVSSSTTGLTLADIRGASYANLNYVPSYIQADSTLASAITVKDGTTPVAIADKKAFSDAYSFAANASAAGTSGNLTFSTDKSKIAFAGGGTNGKKQDVDILAATATVKVNVLSSVTKKNDGVTIGNKTKQTIPFKVFTSTSADVTASEVADADGTALTKASTGISIDNTNKNIVVDTTADDTAKFIKFAPKDSTKSGTGTVVKIIPTGTAAIDSTMKVADTTEMIVNSAVSVGTNDSAVVTLAGSKPVARGAGDVAGFVMKDDALDGKISATFLADATGSTAVVNKTEDTDNGTAANNVSHIKFTVANGVPAGTYTGYLTYADARWTAGHALESTVLYFQPINIVVTGAASDTPYNIGINKVNNTTYWTYGDFMAAHVVSYILEPDVNGKLTEAANTTKKLAAETGLGAGDYSGAGNAKKIVYSTTIKTKNHSDVKISATVTYSGSNQTLISAGDEETIAALVAGDSADATKASKVESFTINGSNYTIKQAKAAYDKLQLIAYQSATLLSGADTEITLTSPIKEAGVVSDVAIGGLQVEDNETGARIADGFTADGMKIKIAADKLVAGKKYRVFVTTKGTGIKESDAMSTSTSFILLTVKQGYEFAYNLGNGTVKAGKTLAKVSISSNEATSVKLENGENIELTGATFLGWAYTDGKETADISASDAANLKETAIKTAIDKQVNGVINLYAVWDYTKYKMSFDNNAGTGTETDKAFTVASTDVTLPSTGFSKGDKPLVGWATSSTGKTATGATLPVYTGTLNSAQLQAIVKEVDPTAKTAAIKMYAQYGAALKTVEITPATLALEAGKTGTVSAVAKDETGAAMTTPVITFKSDNEGVATVDANGVVTAVAEGTANITATATLGSVSVTSASACVVTVKAAEEPVVTKKANTLTVKGKTVTVKKGKKVTLKVAKVLTVKNAKGTVTYTKKSGNKKITIKKTTGKVTVKKGLKKGTYKVKVAVKAAGNASYKAKTVTKTFKIKVK